MGIRNMAIIGTHKDFAADIYDQGWGEDPSTVTHCASHWDAAVSYFKSIFENSNGLIRERAVVVWPIADGPQAAMLFRVTAKLTPRGDDGEFDVVIDAVDLEA